MTRPRAGEVGTPIQVGEPELSGLLRNALAQDADPQAGFVWQDLDSELMVDMRGLQVAVRQGLLLVGLRVRCDEVGGNEGHGTDLVVPIALGTRAEPAGLVGISETAARGPSALVVAVWGETAVAAAWLAFLDVCRAVAARAGEDDSCRPMVPGAVWAEPGVLTVVPQAGHAIDRASRR